MLNLFMKKDDSLVLYRPAKGKVIDITDVQDKMFSEKLMGDGIAIEPENDEIAAPCDGKVLLVPKTLHAVAMEGSNGAELLIHIGIDTVELKGQGFTCHVNSGDVVKRGDKLISFDREFIAEKGKKLVTPVVVTNADEKGIEIRKNLNGNSDIIMELTVRVR
jgi:glucose-specific phosphotransferase system IIA component